MADNVGYTPGEGVEIAADEIDGVLHQRAKMQFGDDGIASDVSSTNPLPVAVLNLTDNGLTDVQLRATPVQVAPDNTAALMSALRALIHPIWEEAASGRLRVVLDPIGGAQTLGTVTTVGTVSNMTSVNQIAAVPANSFIYDQMHAAWCNSVRRAVS